MKFKFLIFKNFSLKMLFFLALILIIITICIIKTSTNKNTLSTLTAHSSYVNSANTKKSNTKKKIENNKTLITEKEITIKSNLPTDFKGYTISALLEIPKIELSTYVLNEYSEDALKTSVVKLTGPSPNKIGNFCIVGHNYIKDNMFSKLKKLEIGDRLFLTDNLNRKLEYEVYSIDKVNSKNLECLTQDTDYNKEITLITCTTGALKRLVIKCTQVTHE